MKGFSSAAETTAFKVAQKKIALMKLEHVLKIGDIRMKASTMIKIAKFYREKNSRISKNDSVMSISLLNMDEK